MKLYIWILPCLIFVSLDLSAQNSREIAVDFIVKGESIRDVKYYIVQNNSEKLLHYDDGFLTIYTDNMKNGEVAILVKYKKKNIKFKVKPMSMFYLKITEQNKCIKKVYEINQGFDYVELVSKSDKRYFYD